MVSIELDNILVSSIFVMQIISVVWLNEVVLVGSCKQCGDECLGHMINGGYLFQVEVGFGLDGLLD